MWWADTDARALHDSSVWRNQPHWAPPTLGLHCTHFLRPSTPHTPLPSYQQTPGHLADRGYHGFASTQWFRQGVQAQKTSMSTMFSPTKRWAKVGLCDGSRPWRTASHRRSCVGVCAFFVVSVTCTIQVSWAPANVQVYTVYRCLWYQFLQRQSPQVFAKTIAAGCARALTYTQVVHDCCGIIVVGFS